MRKYFIKDFSLLEYTLIKNMAPDINVDLGFDKITFTQAEIKCTNLLNVYRDKEKCEGRRLLLRISPDNPWHNFLVSLFSTYHTEWLEKTEGDSIVYFYIGRTTYDDGKIGTPCLFFKLKHLKTNYEENHLGFSSLRKNHKPISSVLKACRYAIREDIENFRVSEIKKLKETGIYDESKRYQVHHAVKPFKQISDEWIENNGGVNVLYRNVCSTLGNRYETKFLDDSLSRSFRDFHKENAVLQLLTQEDHRRIHGKKL